KYEEGIHVAQEAMPRLAGTPHALSLAVGGLDCALSLPAENAKRAEWARDFEGLVRAALADPSLKVAGDDRSSAYGELVDARKDAHDSAGADRRAEDWAPFLEGEAAKGKTPEERAVYDPHRLSAYIELGEPERAVPMLQASERDLPGDYNPPARLATAYKAMKRYDDALAASDRALAKAYGPRKIGILQTRADIQAAKGDTAAARNTIEETLRYAEELPAGHRTEKTIASIRKKLEGMP